MQTAAKQTHSTETSFSMAKKPRTACMHIATAYIKPAVASLQKLPTVFFLQQQLVPLDLFDDHTS